MTIDLSATQLGPTWGVSEREAGAALAKRLFVQLEEETRDSPGVTRTAFGEGERRAYAIIEEAGSALGLEQASDAAGNLFLKLPGLDRSKTILIGSHLDSVPHGGNYDGAAGVILGLAVQATFRAADRQPPIDLCTICLRAEESCWFPHSYIGSKTALGVLDPAVLEEARRTDTGNSLGDHMRMEGFDPEAVRRGASLIDQRQTVAYIEPHIEQGDVLLANDVPLGVVTGIRGSFRYREACCVGVYAHSGATPRDLRRDAVLATADLIMRTDRLWTDLLAEGHDVVITFGMLNTDHAQHSFSKVAGKTSFCVDVRSQSTATLSLVEAEFLRLSEAVAQDRGVRFALGARSGSMPAQMSPVLAGLLRGALRRSGLQQIDLASGAGHDAATFALAGIPTAMLFIRNRNGSHNPQEEMDFGDFVSALTAMTELMRTPAKSWPRNTL